MRLRKIIPLLPVALALAGCSDIQSVLAPRGPHAARIETLGWVMFIGGGLIFLLVFVLTAIAIFLPHRRRRWLGDHKVVVIGGIVFPIVVLSALVVYGFFISRALVTDPGEPALRVEVVGERWWWRVHYLGESGEVQFATANEIRIPVGRPVQFVLKAQDVIHSFWVPSLAGKLDMIPGHVNSYTFSADRAGVYRGQCAEYCGAQHAKMAFYVVAMEPEEFEAWALDQAQPAEEPFVSFLESGQALFVENGCGACHTIRGTEAEGKLGPDLTHVGSRLSLGAGMFPNNVGTFAGWIASVQHLKPDVLMPSYGNLEGEELRAIAAYLESLN